LQADQLLRERSYPIDVTAAPTKVHPHIAAVGPTQARKRLRECRVATLPLRIIFVVRHEHADAPYAVALLRARRERPRDRRAAERSDEFAPPDAEHGFPGGNAVSPLLCSTKRIAPRRGDKQPAALRTACCATDSLLRYGLHCGISLVLYRGLPPKMQDLVAGRIDFFFDSHCHRTTEPIRDRNRLPLVATVSRYPLLRA
jgi:hypothetical protein